jgi:serine/threonine-protein kinase
MDVREISSGEVVAGRYRATRRIASGAMGEVWEGVHRTLGHRVALKVLRRESLACTEVVRRFTREAFLLARIESDHVVRVIDFVARSKHGPVLVMEMVEGESLAEVVARERVSVEDAVDIAIDVTRALRAIHERKVIHRDVKPGNIMLRRTEDGRREAVLVDFGVGRLVDDPEPDGAVTFHVDGEELTTADRIVGTVEYMAPEQIVSCQTAEASVDIYAVGAVLHRAVWGHHPFDDLHGADLLRAKLDRPTPSIRLERKDPVAARLATIVALALASRPRDRFQSASELLGALVALRRDIERARHVVVASTETPKRGRLRRNAALAIVAAIGITFASCATSVAHGL